MTLSLSERFPPPSSFREVGSIEWARLSREGPLAVRAARASEAATAAQAAGMRYEQRAHGYLLETFKPIPGVSTPLYAPAMWIRFCTDGRLGWCQPDGLLIDLDRSLITIIEIKLRHTPNAWWALRRLYEPLIRFLFGTSWRYAVCEVCRWYSPGPWPEPIRMCPQPSNLGVNEFGVHIWHDKDWEWQLRGSAATSVKGDSVLSGAPGLAV